MFKQIATTATALAALATTAITLTSFQSEANAASLFYTSARHVQNYSLNANSSWYLSNSITFHPQSLTRTNLTTYGLDPYIRGFSIGSISYQNFWQNNEDLSFAFSTEFSLKSPRYFNTLWYGAIEHDKGTLAFDIDLAANGNSTETLTFRESENDFTFDFLGKTYGIELYGLNNVFHHYTPTTKTVNISSRSIFDKFLVMARFVEAPSPTMAMPQESQSVPEPTSLFGLLAAGAVGKLATFKRNR